MRYSWICVLCMYLSLHTVENRYCNQQEVDDVSGGDITIITEIQTNKWTEIFPFFERNVCAIEYNVIVVIKLYYIYTGNFVTCVMINAFI